MLTLSVFYTAVKVSVMYFAGCIAVFDVPCQVNNMIKLFTVYLAPLFYFIFFITVYCYVVCSNGWPALIGSGLSGNPPLHINILYCMLLMCLQVVNKHSLSLSPFQLI